MAYEDKGLALDPDKQTWTAGRPVCDTFGALRMAFLDMGLDLV